MRGSRELKVGLLAIGCWLLASCEGTTFQSSVPAYPVRVVIDTRIGAFVHFQPTSLGSYVTVNKDGYYLDGQWVSAVSAMDAWGYGGVVAYVSTMGYTAYDLACPYCAEHGRCRTCTIDGMNAVCPECGEEYDLMSGAAVPQKGLSHEAMRRLGLVNADGRITITKQ